MITRGLVQKLRGEHPLKKRQLLSEEQILSRHGDTGSSEEEHEPTEVDQHFVNGWDAVKEGQRVAA